MAGGNPQHNGWAASERQISKANASALKLLYRYQTDNQSRGPNSLTSPIISGNLITYLGFKEMLLFAGSSGRIFSVDADLNRLIWENDLPHAAAKVSADPQNGPCAGGLTSPIVMAGSSSNSLHFAALAARLPAAGGRLPRFNPYLPPLSQSIYPLLPTTLTQLNAAYAVSADGYLHFVNSSTGDDLIPAVRFVPPNGRVTSLNLRDNVVYATTANNCDGYANELYAIDILSSEKTVRSFVPQQDGFAGTMGTGIGNDGTVYLQAAYSNGNDAKHGYETVVALTPKDLKVKDYFTIGNKPLKPGAEIAGITPGVFSFSARDLVIAGGNDGRVYLLDSRALGGADHRTPLFATAAVTEGGKKIRDADLRGAFSTWVDVDTGTRWFYAPVAGKTADGRISAFKLAGTSDAPTLEPLWISAPYGTVLPPVIANGMLFVLSTDAKGATLHILDAVTGKVLNSGVSAPAAPAPSSGLALANGRVYFSGSDNAVYCFGIPGQQLQLELQ